jgi:hypothetical protein
MYNKDVYVRISSMKRFFVAMATARILCSGNLEAILFYVVLVRRVYFKPCTIKNVYVRISSMKRFFVAMATARILCSGNLEAISFYVVLVRTSSLVTKMSTTF